jgi:hypothetical protein
MSESRQFRENAEACEEMARTSPLDRDAFLEIAARWRAMADRAEAREAGRRGGNEDGAG